MRDRFVLADARSLSLCFFFRQMETGFQPSSNSNDTPNPPPASSGSTFALVILYIFKGISPLAHAHIPG